MVDFVKIADRWECPARAERPEQVGPAIRQMLDHDGPFWWTWL
jgi:hypothetical protein